MVRLFFLISDGEFHEAFSVSVNQAGKSFLDFASPERRKSMIFARVFPWLYEHSTPDQSEKEGFVEVCGIVGSDSLMSHVISSDRTDERSYQGADRHHVEGTRV